MFTHEGRGIVARLSGDDSGFTVVEILMASVILLIAFSGVMSLMIANTYMNVTAKEKATLINEANSYVERVRQMQFGDIGTATSTPPGALASYTTTSNGYVIDVAPTVTESVDTSITNSSGVPLTGILKRLVVVLSAHRVGTEGPTYTYRTEAVIKKTDSGVNTAAQLPTINPSASTPASEAVVYGNAVSIGAVASANGDGVMLTSMNFYCDGVPLRNQSLNTAQWSLNSATFSSPAFYWDTTAVNEDGVALSSDGKHTVKLEVWDSNGRQSWYQWQLIVDNSPPIWPADGSIAATATSSTRIDLAWSGAYDGNIPPDHYSINVRKQDTAGSLVDLGSTPYAGVSGAFAASPFSRYEFRVSAIGPPSLSRESTGSASVSGFSRPDISGSTWLNDRRVPKDNKATRTRVTIKITPPTFAYSAGTSIVYRSASPSMTDPYPIGTLSGWSPATFTADDWRVNNGSSPDAKAFYYQVWTTLTFSDGSTQTFYSQVLGPNGTAHGSNTWAELPTVRW